MLISSILIRNENPVGTQIPYPNRSMAIVGTYCSDTEKLLDPDKYPLKFDTISSIRMRVA